MPTTTRDELRRMVEELPEGEVDAALAALERLFRAHADRLQADCDRRMIESGLMERAPDPEYARTARTYRPIRIDGKPVSETIVEERR